MSEYLIWLLALWLPMLAMGLVIAWGVWRFWRMAMHHRRFMRASAEVDKAVATMKRCRTRDQLEMHSERATELLEHLDAMRKER